MVRPAFVCYGNQLSNVDDVFNGIMVYGDGFDQVMFYGRGAGKLPTASAVLGDIIEASKLSGTDLAQSWEDSTDDSFIENYLDDTVQMYVRIVGASEDEINALFGEVEYLERENQPADEKAFVTPALKEREIDEKLEKLNKNVLGTVRVLDF